MNMSVDRGKGKSGSGSFRMRVKMDSEQNSGEAGYKFGEKKGEIMMRVRQGRG